MVPFHPSTVTPSAMLHAHGLRLTWRAAWQEVMHTVRWVHLFMV